MTSRTHCNLTIMWMFFMLYQTESPRLNQVGFRLVNAMSAHLAHHQPPPSDAAQLYKSIISLSTCVVENIIPSCGAVINGWTYPNKSYTTEPLTLLHTTSPTGEILSYGFIARWCGIFICLSVCLSDWCRHVSWRFLYRQSLFSF